MAGLASLASMVGKNSTQKASRAYLIRLDPKKNDAPKLAVSFQYFPDTLSDSKVSNWQAKDIPGASLPLYQWTNSGERSLTFTATFTTDIDPVASGATDAVSVELLKTRLKTNGVERYNVDVRSAVYWLRSFMLPEYSTDKNGLTTPPSKCILMLPNSGIGLAGGDNGSLSPDSVLCVMTQCEVTWEKFFPSGVPRIASVSLGFAQLPQYQGSVWFPGVTDKLRKLALTGGSSGSNTYLGYGELVGTAQLDPSAIGSVFNFG